MEKSTNYQTNTETLISILERAPISNPRFNMSEEDDFLLYLINQGKFWTWNPSRYKTVNGILGQCHFNASKYWLSHKNKTKLVSGFAFDFLSRTWTTHSWCVEGADDDIIIETVCMWPYYYGYVLSNEEAESFSQVHIADYEKNKINSQNNKR
jgi:hypothetical protein